MSNRHNSRVMVTIFKFNTRGLTSNIDPETNDLTNIRNYVLDLLEGRTEAAVNYQYGSRTGPIHYIYVTNEDGIKHGECYIRVMIVRSLEDRSIYVFETFYKNGKRTRHFRDVTKFVNNSCLGEFHLLKRKLKYKYGLAKHRNIEWGFSAKPFGEMYPTITDLKEYYKFTERTRIGDYAFCGGHHYDTVPVNKEIKIRTIKIVDCWGKIAGLVYQGWMVDERLFLYQTHDENGKEFSSPIDKFDWIFKLMTTPPHPNGMGPDSAGEWGRYVQRHLEEHLKTSTQPLTKSAMK